MVKLTRALGVAVVLLLTASHLGAAGREPGSLLVYPVYDSIRGVATVITVTNVNGDHSMDPARRIKRGTVDVEFIYIDGKTCKEFNRTERLSPRDTLTLIASAHCAESALGYLYLFAKDSLTGEPITFNYLIGSLAVVDGIDSIEYGVNAWRFRGATADGTPTDLDQDGIRDLDGTEYEMAPDRLLFPRFFAQGIGFESTLTLINLTGGARFTATVDFEIFNDNEYLFSGEYSFDCWKMVPLAHISGAFQNGFLKSTDHDPAELVGLSFVETGWMRLDGNEASSLTTTLDDPALLGYLVEAVGPFGSADLPFGEGEQGNGDLLPRALEGDP
ncbi:MAG: hypothetical protein AB1486_09160 [Planctomycetota bacterium]